MGGDQIESEIDQIAPEQISRFFLFDGELLGEYESLLIEGSEQGRQLALEDILLQVEKRMRRVCDRRSLINCLRALEVEMDPSTEKWSFNSEILPLEEDLALSA